MKKGQGAKTRDHFLHAQHGVNALGDVGEFIKESYAWTWYDCLARAGYKKKSRTPLEENRLREDQDHLARSSFWIAQKVMLLVHGARYNKSGAKFFAALAKALENHNAYPGEVRVLDAYTAAQIEGRTLTKKELLDAVRDESGNPDKSTFSRIVKRYRLELKNAKSGRSRTKAGSNKRRGD
jgi:hypothetical protein